MDSTWRRLILAFAFLVGLASSEVTITLLKPLRLGKNFGVYCSASSKIKQCLWEANGRLIESSAMRPAPSRSEMECGVEAKATEDLNGSFSCKVFTESGDGIAESANTTVSVIRVPNLSLRPAVRRLSVTSGEEKQIICVVNNARPVPSIVWKIGGREIDPKDYTTTSQVGNNGMVNLNSVLKREFVPLEHNKDLQCSTKADWLREEDNTVAQTMLDVQFPPMPEITTTIVMKKNKPGEVRVTVQANPRPHRAFWILPTPSHDKLEVEEQLDGEVDINYFGYSGEDNGNGTYTYRLSISSVNEQDSYPGIKFQVFNRVGGSEHSQQYFVTKSVHINVPISQEEQDLIVSLIAAICIVVVLLVIGMCWRYKRIWKRKAPFPMIHKVVHPGANAFDNQECYISHSDIHLHLPPLPPSNSLKYPPTPGQLPTPMQYPTPTPEQYLSVRHLYSPESDSSSSAGYYYDDVVNPHSYEQLDFYNDVVNQHIYERLDDLFFTKTDFDNLKGQSLYA